MQPTPQPEHQWLLQLVGEWTSEMKASMGPGEPEQTFVATERVRAIGELWVVCESTGESPIGPSLSIMTLGYDPTKQRFVGNFIGSSMAYHWVYEGQLDAAKKVLTLDTLGPSFEDQAKLVKYQDIIEIISPTERTLTARYQGADGQWQQLMVVRYQRKS